MNGNLTGKKRHPKQTLLEALALPSGLATLLKSTA